jgi:hypothetical protein
VVTLRLLVRTTVLLLVASGGTAAAEESRVDQTAAARALFEEGLSHGDAGRWAEAADRFERARLLRPSPEITYNLTTALVHEGKLVRASEHLRRLMDEPQAPPPVREAAGARLAELLPRLAHLTIEAPGTPDGPVGAVVVDQQPIDAARLGVPLPMDPASHRIELHQGSAVVEVQVVTLREGERRTITLQKRGPGLTFDTKASAHDPSSPAPTAPSSPSRAWAWALVGALAVGVTTTAVLVSRDGPAPPAGNVDTWTLGR